MPKNESGSWPETLHLGAVLDLVFERINAHTQQNNSNASSVPAFAGTLIWAWVNIFMLTIVLYLKFIQVTSFNVHTKKFVEVNSIINLLQLR